MLAVLAWTPLGRLLAVGAAASTEGLPPLLSAPVELALFVGAVVLLWELAVLPAVLLAGSDPIGRQTRRPPLWEAFTAQAHATMVAWPAVWLSLCQCAGSQSQKCCDSDGKSQTLELHDAPFLQKRQQPQGLLRAPSCE